MDRRYSRTARLMRSVRIVTATSIGTCALAQLARAQWPATGSRDVLTARPDILYKPVDRDALVRAITKVMSGRALSHPVPGTS